jgi:hypothetical protein
MYPPLPLWSEQIYATFSSSDGKALKVRFLKSSAALKIMARNHPTTHPISAASSSNGLWFSKENIAQPLALSSKFGFRSENKNLGTGVTSGG